MAVGLPEKPQLDPVPGVRLATAMAGIRKPGRRDLLVIEAAPGSQVAAVFTRNRFCAAPVVVARDHLAQAAPRYCLVNAGNANAGTGAAGLQAALTSCRSLASLAGCEAQAVLPFSTGVIGEPLPVERIETALPTAFAALSADAWLDAAHAIMTTDTLPKGLSVHFEVAGQPAVLTGIVKGAGMIRPDMATMLAFIASDVNIDKSTLQACLQQAVDRSLNRITIDGDTSTNDACLLLATGASAACVESEAAIAEFQAALDQLCSHLAQAVVRDGEGATRFVTVTVAGGSNDAECLRVAYAIAESPLVKTALFAADPNWGRILAAVGRSGPQDLDIDGVAIYIDDYCIVRDGGRAADYQEADVQAIMDGSEYTLRVDLGRGTACETVWTCDLSHDYVRINAEYRT
ncbi:glutamate N-acetyltransferase/amino-acid N-acetyltransferase [Methylohalomonas lacus]|uniref:Arginine biosynthesis bifunctional protein ArgJ n=1 Tax=Methylohalomonas lacus TaxID=398773 RepID=A0AAE3HJM4_9GAMM|nr:bifunctional glutamate N-acetyltransferase/amino-acid acetyltransferase ArgJ [Methylohalomonas lacus]MCS3902264.1 glutamate N-acetyltransferase/amino-acid N-acetyltransferase [Methylohalomonas lacus]